MNRLDRDRAFDAIQAELHEYEAGNGFGVDALVGALEGCVVDEQPALEKPRLARYYTTVYPANRHAGYGWPVEVLAGSAAEARTRAVDIGWSGRREDALIRIDRIEDMP